MTIENQDQNQPKYFIDEGIPGVGERPTWLSDKFKTVADLGKSYTELEKKFGTVPDEYDISRSTFLDHEHAGLKDFLQFAKQQRVSKEVVDKLVDTLDGYVKENSIDPQHEFKQLGDNAKERITTLDNWAKANLSEDSYKALANELNTASTIKALEEIRNKMMSNNTQIPPGNDKAGSNVNSVADIQNELVNNLQKYKTDADYRKNIQGRLEQASKVSGYVDKSAT